MSLFSFSFFAKVVSFAAAARVGGVTPGPSALSPNARLPAMQSLRRGDAKYLSFKQFIWYLSTFLAESVDSVPRELQMQLKRAQMSAGAYGASDVGSSSVILAGKFPDAEVALQLSLPILLTDTKPRLKKKLTDIMVAKGLWNEKDPEGETPNNTASAHNTNGASQSGGADSSRGDHPIGSSSSSDRTIAIDRRVFEEADMICLTCQATPANRDCLFNRCRSCCRQNALPCSPHREKGVGVEGFRHAVYESATHASVVLAGAHSLRILSNQSEARIALDLASKLVDPSLTGRLAVTAGEGLVVHNAAAFHGQYGPGYIPPRAQKPLFGGTAGGWAGGSTSTSTSLADTPVASGGGGGGGGSYAASGGGSGSGSGSGSYAMSTTPRGMMMASSFGVNSPASSEFGDRLLDSLDESEMTSSQRRMRNLRQQFAKQSQVRSLALQKEQDILLTQRRLSYQRFPKDEASEMAHQRLQLERELDEPVVQYSGTQIAQRTDPHCGMAAVQKRPLLRPVRRRMQLIPCPHCRSPIDATGASFWVHLSACSPRDMVNLLYSNPLNSGRLRAVDTFIDETQVAVAGGDVVNSGNNNNNIVSSSADAEGLLDLGTAALDNARTQSHQRFRLAMDCFSELFVGPEIQTGDAVVENAGLVPETVSQLQKRVDATPAVPSAKFGVVGGGDPGQTIAHMEKIKASLLSEVREAEDQHASLMKRRSGEAERFESDLRAAKRHKADGVSSLDRPNPQGGLVYAEL
jgi:LRP1 type putative zinc finger protein